MELSGEMVVTPAAVDAIAAPQKILAIVELELVVETADDYFGETIAEGFQCALKLEFGRCCPELSRSYDLHTQIREGRTGSKIYTLRAAPVLRNNYRHLERDVQDLKRALLDMQKEAQTTRSEAAKKTTAGKIVATIAALTTVLNFGVSIHTFGEKWGLVQDQAQQRIEQDDPGTISKVTQIALFPPPPETEGQPPSGDFIL